MELYRIVKAIATVGQGDVISVDDKQLRRRLPFVDVVKKAAGEAGRHTVRTKKVLEFKVGEIVGLAEKPKSDRFELVNKTEGAPAPKGASKAA